MGKSYEAVTVAFFFSVFITILAIFLEASLFMVVLCAAGIAVIPTAMLAMTFYQFRLSTQERPTKELAEENETQPPQRTKKVPVKRIVRKKLEKKAEIEMDEEEIDRRIRMINRRHKK